MKVRFKGQLLDVPAETLMPVTVEQFGDIMEGHAAHRSALAQRVIQVREESARLLKDKDDLLTQKSSMIETLNRQVIQQNRELGTLEADLDEALEIIKTLRRKKKAKKAS
jgi:t-SNARE complex subunit (syntaxin)